MLTPYQFSSNRPIDGIDLDGKEWTKTETYDPETGVTKVHFSVKLKVVNQSKIFTDVKTLKEMVAQQFAIAFQDVGNSKTQYSSSIDIVQVEKIVDGDFAVLVHDIDGVMGGMSTVANTKANTVQINARSIKEPHPARAAKDMAKDLVHELIHTAGVDHPNDENQAPDIQVLPNNSNATDGTPIFDNILGPNADINLVKHNIMLYPRTKVDGKPIKDYLQPGEEMNKVSPGQSKKIQEQINKDEKKPH
jgi:hypothetical protein